MKEYKVGKCKGGTTKLWWTSLQMCPASLHGHGPPEPAFSLFVTIPIKALKSLS